MKKERRISGRTNAQQVLLRDLTLPKASEHHVVHGRQRDLRVHYKGIRCLNVGSKHYVFCYVVTCVYMGDSTLSSLDLGERS